MRKIICKEKFNDYQGNRIKNETKGMVINMKHEELTGKTYPVLHFSHDIPSFFRREYKPYSYGYCNSFMNEDLCLQEFTYSMIFGNFNLDNLSQILKIFNISALPNVLMIAHIEGCDYIHSPGPSTEFFPIKLNISSEIADLLKKNKIAALCYPISNTDQIAIFLCLETPHNHLQKYQETLSNIARLIIRQVREQTEERISIGISNPCPSYSRFTLAYEECKKALDRLFMDENEPFQFFREIREECLSANPVDMTLYISKIIQIINHLKTEDLLQTISEALNYLANLQLPASRIRLNLINMINHIGDYYTNLHLEDIAVENIGIQSIKKILSAHFCSSLEQIIFNYCAFIIKSLNLKFRSSETRLKLLFDDCFERMYMNPNFTISLVAAIANYNKYYLGRLFKKIYGVNFNQFLMQYRIKKAQRLLKETFLNIDEISECVGFYHTSYFCTVFKKLVRKSPKQYRDESV